MGECKKLAVVRSKLLIQSIDSFLKQLGSHKPRLTKTMVYRGHSDFGYELQPSVLRDSPQVLADESELLYGLMSAHPEEFYDKRTTFDTLVHAQHHGLPTRLLDVTMSPLAALYFAVETCSPTNGAVLACSVDNSRMKNFESDALSCICNLAKLSPNEQQIIRNWINENKTKTGKISRDVKGFNEVPAVKRLVQIIKNEKPYFENKIKPVDLWSFFLAMPTRNNSRVIAQSGAFLVSGVLSKLGTSGKITVKTIKIDATAKKLILTELDALGINRSTIYPGLESTARYLSKDRPFLQSYS